MGGGLLRHRRFAAGIAAAVLLAGLIPGCAAAAAVGPKVAIIVGPAGTAVTARYRQAAEAAAAIAETLTPNVVRVYSPDATWPAVRAAVTDASVVVYLGHGNGWPSRYAKTLQPRTMDGFGLNPVGGVDDVAHQYFGEAFISRLHFAPGAVVLLSHLCYASGSTEPGLDDGSLNDVVARVDDFATGFLKAGASAVVAEGHADPGALIAAAIHGPATIARAWTSARWGHGNIASYASTRTPGATLSVDPDKVASGYYRSIVRAPGGSLRPSAVVGPEPVVLPVAPPSLASAGMRFGQAVLNGVAAPGQVTRVQVPVTRVPSALPASLLVGVRWLPLVGTDTGSTASTDDGLVVGEAVGDVVETASGTGSAGALGVDLAAPTAPGTYVVLLTLEAPDGTAYDVATQALLRPFTVVVPKPIDLRITAPASLTGQPGTALHLTVNLTNTGTQAWGSPLFASMWSDPTLDPALGHSFSQVLALNASWLDPIAGTATAAAAYPLPRSLGMPGASASVEMSLRTPPMPGRYLLVLSLAVHGSLGEFPDEPLLVPVTVDVDAAASPSAVPSLGS